jgi:hypothetical protein
MKARVKVDELRDVLQHELQYEPHEKRPRRIACGQIVAERTMQGLKRWNNSEGRADDPLRCDSICLN